MASFAELAGTVVIGVVVGLMSLVYYDRWMADRRTRTPADHWVLVLPPRELTAVPRPVGRTPAGRLAVMIAIGIGLHNFAEGLAIGQSAASGEISLALLLIIGFGLHNATEGFGIVAPLHQRGRVDPAGASWPARPHRRRPDLRRHPHRPRRRQRRPVRRLPRAGGRFDPLRDHRAAGVSPTRWGAANCSDGRSLLGLFLGFATDFIIVAAGA